MVGRRLFIGNLPRETLRSDLESVLTSTLTALNGSTFHSIEIRQKNDATFAFVDVDSQQIEKCVSDLNEVTVKGQLLKVQMAKENFMERLKKEREGLHAPAPAPRRIPDHQQGHGHGQDRGQFPERDNWRTHSQSRPYQPRGRPSGDYDFEIVPLSKNDQKNSNSKSTSNQNQTEKEKSESEDSSEEEEEKGGVPMFRGLGFYPGLLQPRTELLPPVSVPPKPKIVQQPPSIPIDSFQQKMLAIAANKPIPRSNADNFRRKFDNFGDKSEPEPIPPATTTTTTFAGGLKLNPRKKERSDQLRVESFDRREQFQKSRSDLIRTALSNTNIRLAEPVSKKPKKDVKTDFLFGNEEEEEDYSNSLRVKPQYEGKAGQKMLELNANFAWDPRFQIDERFADEEERKIPDSTETEKNTQLDILGQILGKTIEKTHKVIQDDFQVITRYDPTREDHKVFEVNYDKEKMEEGQQQQQIETKNKLKSNASSTLTSDLQENEKSTFKVAPNLKNLFNDTGFSLLSTFGGSPTKPKTTDNDNDENDGQGQPRSFWNKNPFKYDSSDDEEEKEPKITTKVALLKPGEKPRNYFKEDLFKRESFFFRENDERLSNVFNEFLSIEENLEEVKKKFNDLGRSELKLIAKSKWKNSKRKNEKRVKIMRLVRRKKRREAKAKDKAKNQT